MASKKRLRMKKWRAETIKCNQLLLWVHNNTLHRTGNTTHKLNTMVNVPADASDVAVD